MSLAAILAWKFNNAPGIRTRGLPGGGAEIFDWPLALGPVPTQADIDLWTGEYDARPVSPGRLNADQLTSLLLSKAVISQAEIDAARAGP